MDERDRIINRFVTVDVADYDRSRSVGVVHVAIVSDWEDDGVWYDGHERTFVSHIDLKEHNDEIVTSRPYGAACDYATQLASKFKCDWGTNE